MKTGIKNILIGYLLAALLSQCRKNSTTNSTAHPTITSFSQLFDEFWTNVDRNYVYWDIDTTNWNRIYSTYKPLFAALNLNDNGDVLRSVNYFRQLTSSLLDAHFEIQFTNGGASGQIVFPASERKQQSAAFHFPYNYSNTDSHYFDPGYISVFDNSINPGPNALHVTVATIKQSVLYFSCNQFALQQSYSTSGGNAVQRALDTFFKKLNDPATPVSGVIIDVRNNLGGNVSDLNFLMGHFISQPLHFGYSAYKNGPGKLDFTPWINASVNPSATSGAITVPVVALADNYTASLAEIVAMTVHALPKGTVIGETTWGATGPLIDHDVYNDGQFEIPGYMVVYTSSAKFKYLDNKIYESIGFPADTAIPFNQPALNSGTDAVLEKAIQVAGK